MPFVLALFLSFESLLFGQVPGFESTPDFLNREAQKVDFSTETFPPSPQFNNFLINLLNLQVSLNPGLSKGDPRFNTALYLALFGESLFRYPGMKTLVTNFFHQTVDKKFLQDFVSHHISNDFQPIFADEMESFFKKDPEAKEFLQKVIENDISMTQKVIDFQGSLGTIDDSLYFYLMSRKRIPLLEVHDILVHLPLMQSPEIRRQTLELAQLYNFYFSSRRKHYYKRNVHQLLKGIWYGLQESIATVTEFDDGRKRLFLSGGESLVGALRLQHGEPHFLGLKEAFNHQFSAIDSFQELKSYQRILGWLSSIAPETRGSVSERISSLMSKELIVEKDKEEGESSKSILELWNSRQDFFKKNFKKSPEKMKLFLPQYQHQLTKLILQLAQEAMGVEASSQNINELICPLF